MRTVQRRYHLLDVFTQTPLAGNPLAVVSDANGLDAARMQKIAAEFNLSETVFLLPPREPDCAARLRIFTPKAELAFAGHPTVGTAVLLAVLRTVEAPATQELPLTLEEEIGLIACRVRRLEGKAGRATFALPRLPAEAGFAPSNDRIAAALGLDSEDIGFAGHRPSIYSVGLPFAFVPVAGLATIARARPVPALFETVFSGLDAAAAFIYTSDTVEAHHAFHARMFAPGLGLAEDPATGSAAAALAGAILAFERPADGRHAFVIEQGFEMGRPSLLTLEIEIQKGALIAGAISGSAVIVAEGVIDL
ncbi:PhzF family phenazine biosynthesis protein [Methylocapsa acidiphila]|uniref:PhzF family phenazine biosynthesis protein n=1 Tax=Methylocapsa acidiphila TaxID=133552 RepID=UPI000423DE9B|nr:PhzF family phenazine biosynthesis protein [Methylocapsa acidiphila]